MKLKIEVDDREDSKMLKILERVNVIPVVKRLKVGDYVHDEVCIERKTIDDFCNSIIDGRLREQIKRMEKTYKKNFILISKGIGQRKSEVHEHVVLANIASICARTDVCVLMFDDDYQLAYCMIKIFEKYEDEKKKERRLK